MSAHVHALQLVRLYAPQIWWLYNDPGSGELPFGTHSAFLTSPGMHWSKGAICGGSLTLAFPHGDRAVSRPVHVVCSGCEFCFTISTRGVTDALEEWMRIVVGAAIQQLRDKPRFSESTSVFDAELHICRPASILVDLEDDSSPRSCPTWRDFGFAISEIVSPPNGEALEDLLISAVYLMGHLERTFQGAAKRASGHICSASEAFHPESRRE